MPWCCGRLGWHQIHLFGGVWVMGVLDLGEEFHGIDVKNNLKGGKIDFC